MKSKKERAQFDTDRYKQIVNDANGPIHRADIYEKMAPSIKRWIVDNIDYSVEAWFERVEQTVLRAMHALDQTEFGFVLQKDAIIALGDSQRVRVGQCDHTLCEIRCRLLTENRDRQVIAADREIAAWQAVMSQLKPGQTLDEVLAP